MVCKNVCIGVLAAVLTAGPASATEGTARLTSTEGKVLVNQGAGFLPASGGMSINVGDKIFVGREASASITYVADNCQVAAPAGRVLTVRVLSPCQDKTVQIQPAADLPQEAQAAVPAAFPWPLLLIPAVLCVAFCFEDDDDEVSP
jgi:hypothetical protein